MTEKCETCRWARPVPDEYQDFVIEKESEIFNPELHQKLILALFGDKVLFCAHETTFTRVRFVCKAYEPKPFGDPVTPGEIWKVETTASSITIVYLGDNKAIMVNDNPVILDVTGAEWGELLRGVE